MDCKAMDSDGDSDHLQDIDIDMGEDIYPEEEQNEPSPVKLVEEPIIQQQQSTIAADFKTRKFEITVKIQVGITQYYENIEYTVWSKLDGQESHKVTRSFRHFEWLMEVLRNEHMGIIVPAAPQRSVLAKLNIMDQTNQIRDRRYYQLIDYMKKIVEHPILSQSEHCDIFFTGSLNEIQDQLDKLEQYKSYMYQMSNLVINTGYSVLEIAKGSFKYISSFISKDQHTSDNQQQIASYQSNIEMNSLFESWEDIFHKEQNKLKKISEEFRQYIINKLDQIEQLKKVSKNIEYMNMPIADKLDEKLSSHVYICETNLTQIKQKYVYQLELYVLDLEEAIKVVKRRSQLIETIRNLIKVHNDHDVTIQQKTIYQRQLNETTTQLKQLEQQFPQNTIEFAKQFNENVTTIIKQFYDCQKQIYQELQKAWES